MKVCFCMMCVIIDVALFGFFFRRRFITSVLFLKVFHLGFSISLFFCRL